MDERIVSVYDQNKVIVRTRFPSTVLTFRASHFFLQRSQKYWFGPSRVSGWMNACKASSCGKTSIIQDTIKVEIKWKRNSNVKKTKTHHTAICLASSKGSDHKRDVQVRVNSPAFVATLQTPNIILQLPLVQLVDQISLIHGSKMTRSPY